MANEKDLIIPGHIAIIMDGNGRWAKKRLMPRGYGHQAGGKTLEKVSEDAYRLGVKYLTVYAFSTENWSRPQQEVDTLMNLLRDYLKDSVKNAKKNNMRVRVIGDISRLDTDIQDQIRLIEKDSAQYDGLNLQIAINYGGRDELVRAAKKMAKAYMAGETDIGAVGEAEFNGYLDTCDIPEPELLIRTGGEIRVSNFLLWQMAYTEFYFTDVFWPDFDRAELVKAIEYYNGIERRFGNA